MTMPAPAPDAHQHLVHATGWIGGMSGYNVHTRGLFGALSRRLPVILSPVRSSDGDRRAILERFPERRLASIALLYGSMAGVLDRAPGPRIAYTVWESTRLPDDWHGPLAGVDRIWTATPWGKRVLVANGFTADRVDVVPEGVDTTLFHPAVPPALPRPGPFRFLAVGRWERRKGLSELVAAFDAEFGDGDDVELVLAGLHAHQPDLDLGAKLRGLGLRRPGRLKIVPAVRTHATFAGLYTACDAFVAPSRAEGWGLPATEAMACGLPVIVTGYSGPTAFIGQHAYRIDHRLVPVDERFFERADGDLGLWAEPDWAHLRHLMRRVHRDREEARARGLAGAREVAERLTWDHAAAVAEALIRAAPRPPMPPDRA